MNRRYWPVAVIAGYLLSGFYIVGSDEQVAIQRFGRWQPELRTSGLHWDGPYPFARSHRLNLAELRTVSIGASPGSGDELLPTSPQRTCTLLTGDKNVLQLRAQLHYRIDPAHIDDYLFRHVDRDQRLAVLLEALFVETSSQVGVDYLHTMGIAALNARLTTEIQHWAEFQQLGIVVDRVTLESVTPPAQVLADFQDVANARLEAAQAVQQARTSAEQRLTAAAAKAQDIAAKAESERRAAITAATGQAERFRRLHSELQASLIATTSELNPQQRWETQLTRELWQSLRQRGVRIWMFGTKDPVQLSIESREKAPAASP